MIEAGKKYELTTFDGETYERRTAEVLEVNMPLIRVEGPGGPLIINVHSSAFVSAEIDDPAERERKHQEWMQSLEGQADAQRRREDDAKIRNSKLGGIA